MNTYTKTFLICPHCSAKTDSSIDHLQQGQKIGPWYCDECGKGMTFTMEGKNTAVLKSDKFHENTLDLLVIPPQDKPIYLVLDGIHFPGDKNNDGWQRSNAERQAFFYEEHSCPTNWLRKIRMVAIDGDTDPHGTIKFVRSVICPELPKDDCNAEDQAVIELFPEVLT